MTADALVDLLETIACQNPAGALDLLHDLAADNWLDVTEPAPGVWVFTLPHGATVAEVQLCPT